MRQIQVVHELGVTSAVAIYRLMYGTIVCVVGFIFCKSTFSLILMTYFFYDIIPFVYNLKMSLAGDGLSMFSIQNSIIIRGEYRRVGGGELSCGSGDLPPSPLTTFFWGTPTLHKEGGGGGHMHMRKCTALPGPPPLWNPVSAPGHLPKHVYLSCLLSY